MILRRFMNRSQHMPASVLSTLHYLQLLHANNPAQGRTSIYSCLLPEGGDD
jgi:hypothetical protein